VSRRARTRSHMDWLRLCCAAFGAAESERDDGFSRRVGGRERVFRPPVVENPTWQPPFRRSN
jgi:hypothetical protein